MNDPIRLVLLSGLALLAVGCAAGPTQTQSPAAATSATSARSDSEAMRTYEHAMDLAGSGQIASSLVSFQEAERRFGDKDPWGKSIAIYGRANALERVGRCDEASAAYSEYATFVRTSDPGSADMALSYAAGCKERSVENPALDAVVARILSHQDAAAVAAADRAASSENTSPWLDYYRATALAGLGRTNDAVDAFKTSERRFADNAWARSISIYGRARALNDAQRCSEARLAYAEYAAFVRPSDPRSADMALAYATQCR